MRIFASQFVGNLGQLNYFLSCARLCLRQTIRPVLPSISSVFELVVEAPPLLMSYQRRNGLKSIMYTTHDWKHFIRIDSSYFFSLCLSLFLLLLTRLLVTTASAMSWSSCSSRLRSISSESRKESRCAVSSALTAFLSVIDCFSLRTSCMKVKIQLSVRLPDGSSPYRHTRGCYTLEYWNTSWQLLYVYTVRPPRTNLSIKPCGAWRFLSRGSCARR